MKRVVIEQPNNDIVLAKDIRPQSVVIGGDAVSCKWVAITMIGSTYNVVYLDSIGCLELYKDRAYATILDAVRDCSLVQFYQFPDFRSAMQYYLEQTK